MNNRLLELGRERKKAFDKTIDAIKEDDNIVRLYWENKLNDIDKEMAAIRKNQKYIKKYFYQCRICDEIFQPKEVEEFDETQGWDIIKSYPSYGADLLKVIWRSVSLVPQVELTKFGIER